MQQYYYLNEERKPVGPHSEDEMRAFLLSGMLKEDRLAAVAGSSSWKTLGELLAESGNTPKEAAAIGNCPKCKQEIISLETPSVCPHCRQEIHSAANGNLWKNFVYAMRHYADFKGRATRSEFWGFYLFWYIISMGINFAGQMFMAVMMNEELMRQMMLMQDHALAPSLRMEAVMNVYGHPIMLAAVVPGMLYSLATILPMLAVTVRRLHDRGHGSWSVWMSILALMLVSVSLIFLLGMGMMGQGKMSGMENLLILIMVFSFLVYVVLGFSIFIMMLLPGKRGANKYGPSTLYPHG